MKYDDAELFGAMAFGAGIGAIAAVLFMLAVSDSLWHSHLVKQGHAEWVSDEHGNAEFKLKEMK